MYPVSNEFLQKIKENTREYYWTGTITTKNKTKYNFVNKDILKGSAYVNYKCCSGGEIEIGSVNSCNIGVVDNSCNLKLTEIKGFKLGLIYFY